MNNIIIRFGSKLVRNYVEKVYVLIMGTTCASLVSDFLFCYERDFMLPLSNNNQADVIEVFTSTKDIEIACLMLIFLISNKW